MNDLKDGGPAFPLQHGMRDDGMSLRDYFAAKALQGMLASESNAARGSVRLRVAKENGLNYTAQLAVESYAIADAMLAAREV